MDSRPFIGIDFGTSNSSMAWFNARTGQAEIIYNSEGQDKTPSVVYFGKNEILVGTPAQNILEDAIDREDAAGRTIQSIKRNLINPPIIALPGGSRVRPVEVVATILAKLKRDAENGHFGEPVNRTVITCPAEYDTSQRKVIRDAAIIAGFTEVKLVDEPVAAAIAFRKHGQKVGKGVLVYDLGGGTFDLAFVVDGGNGSFRVGTETDGDPRCGGDDFDQALYNYCNTLAVAELGRAISLDQGLMDLRFLNDCRKRKENLSSSERATFSSYLSDGTRFTHQVDRGSFEEMIASQVDRTVRKTESMMRKVKDEGNQVDTVVLIGGSTRVPLVRKRLNQVLTIEPLDFQKKDVAVSLGAAYYAQEAWGADSRPHQVPVLDTDPDPVPAPGPVIPKPDKQEIPDWVWVVGIIALFLFIANMCG